MLQGRNRSAWWKVEGKYTGRHENRMEAEGRTCRTIEEKANKEGGEGGEVAGSCRDKKYNRS